MHNISKNDKKLIYSSFTKGNNTVIIKKSKQKHLWYNKKGKECFVSVQKKQKIKWLYKKGKKELRSEDRSHIRRPKRGDLPCQLVTKMLEKFLCIDVKIFKMNLF